MVTFYLTNSMKNNFLNINPLEPYDIEISLPGRNNFLDPVAVNKLESGIFIESLNDVEDLVEGYFSEEEENYWIDDWRENSKDFLLAGYSDCMDEAIRFLIEEENISPENPIVQNLRDHLEKSKEKIFGAFSGDFLSPAVKRTKIEQDFRFSEPQNHQTKNCEDFG